MHDVVTRELVNVWVVVCSAQANFARALCTQDLSRVVALFPSADIGHLLRMLAFIQKRICAVAPAPADAWLLATRVLPQDDSSLQWSKPGGGISPNLEESLRQLFVWFVQGEK